MAELNPVIFLIPWFVILGIAISMFIQGWMVIHEQHGYTERPNIKRHPEITEIKGDTGVLMTVNFNNLPDEEYNKLNERIHKIKMEELFDEPSTYEDEIEDE